MPSRRPSRRDLLIALNRAQALFGRLPEAAQDRNQNRANDLERIGTTGLWLCIAALKRDDPADEALPRDPSLRAEVLRVDAFKLGEP